MRFGHIKLISLMLLSLTMLVAGVALAAEGDSEPQVASFLMQDGSGGDGEVMPVQDCAECHLDVTSTWSESAHAHAFDNPNYQDALKGVDDPEACYECHVTGLVEATGEFAAPNVTCESCHGQTPENHPEEGSAPVLVSLASTQCATCHVETHKEYASTVHFAEGIECVDCHNVHAGTLHQEDSEANCLGCHQDTYDNYAHNSHAEAEIVCSDCHLFVDPEAPLPTNGQGQRAHTFEQTTVGCLTCHEDLEDGVIDIATGGESTVGGVAAEYAFQLQEAESELALAQNTRNAASWLLMQGGVAGLVMGLSAAWIFRNRLHGGRDGEE